MAQKQKGVADTVIKAHWSTTKSDGMWKSQDVARRLMCR
jgi:hypothetical protein